MKTILVFGGSGFIGSHFIRHILNKQTELRVINFDKLTYAGNPENLKDVSGHRRYSFVRGDIAKITLVANVFNRYKPDYAINFAAETHVDRSIHGHAKDFISTNINGVFNILEVTKNHEIKKLVQVSTDEVYGSLNIDSRSKFKESTQYSPRSPYSASKTAGDLLASAYWATFGVPVVVTHCSNNYGTHQYPEKLIPFFVLRAMANNPLPLYGDGKNVRDWIHVEDHVEALEKILFNGRPGETYNIGGNQELSNIEVATRILKILNKSKSLIKYVQDRPGHDRRYAIDSTKTEKELNWRPNQKFKDSLPEIIAWYGSNQQWVKNALKRLKKINSHIEI
jgi:dTDP-glucose 4,6-dehydratase